MDLLCSDGGPFIVVPRDAVDDWFGSDVENDGEHYESVCEARGWLQSMTVDGINLLVMDEPLNAQWFTDGNDTYIVCSIMSDGEEQISRFLEAGVTAIASDQKVHHSTVEFELGTAGAILLEAAYRGDERDERNSSEAALPPGKYLVHTLHITGSPDFEILLHKFEMRSRPTHVEPPK